MNGAPLSAVQQFSQQRPQPQQVTVVKIAIKYFSTLKRRMAQYETRKELSHGRLLMNRQQEGKSDNPTIRQKAKQNERRTSITEGSVPHVRQRRSATVMECLGSLGFFYQ